MLDFRQVGAELERFRAALSRRPTFDTSILDRVREMYAERSAAIQETQDLQTKRNAANADMQKIMKSGTNEEKAKARDEMKELSNRVKTLESRVTELEATLEKTMLDIPNVPHASVPTGKGEHDNQVVRTWGEKPVFDFQPRDHVEIGETILKMFDFERATKIAGARFVVEYDELAAMERALASFMLDVHVRESGYREVAVPYLANAQAFTGTGQLPKFADDQFKVPFNESTDYYLVPTAEVPVTNLYMDSIIEAEDGALPIAFACYTACFRKEAGSAGRDTRGILRQHQFNKVELVRFADPEKSYEEHEKLVGHAEKILQKLGLHYRVSLLCSGDMSANAAKCYDLEVWLPGQNAYREISSCSNFEDFQARRAKIRYRPNGDKKSKPALVHTLNGSGLAIGRTLVAILENYQERDGSVRVPEVLVPYLGGRTRIEPKSRS
jgi:seryl-tRNA synthetase